LLGASGQSTAVFFYLAKYISKDTNVLADSLSLFVKAKEYVKKYPGFVRADETQEERDLKTLMQRLLNNSEGQMQEMADTTVLNCNRGNKGHLKSSTFIGVFAYSTVKEVGKMLCNVEALVEEDAEEESFLPLDSEEVENLTKSLPQDEMPETDYGTVPIYTTDKGLKVPMMQATLYLDRVHPDDVNNCMKYMNMREYAACCKLVTIDQKEFEKLSAELESAKINAGTETCEDDDEDDADDDSEDATGTEGAAKSREKSVKYLLHTKSPLHNSHAHQVNTKISVVMFYGGKPPVYPVLPSRKG
jgi:hypothetical protein